jgi:DNA-binding NarL/FixJ family response regulator
MAELSLDGLRSAAICCERSGEQVLLASVWQDLVDGRQRVEDGFFTRERCFLLLSLTQGTVCALSGRRRHVLEKLASGQSAKALAYDLDVSVSTVSQDAKLGLGQLGFDRTAGRMHPLLVMSARASVRPASASSGRARWFNYANETFRVIGAPRPDDRLGPILPPAELAVLRALVEGRNYREIAKGRGTSTRTVANQLAAAFRRLGVSGRGHLLEHLTNAHDACA